MTIKLTIRAKILYDKRFIYTAYCIQPLKRSAYTYVHMYMRLYKSSRYKTRDWIISLRLAKLKLNSVKFKIQKLKAQLWVAKFTNKNTEHILNNADIEQFHKPNF